MKSQNKVIEKQLSGDIQLKFEQLDKEIQEIHKRRKIMKEKYQKLLDEGIGELKKIKQEVFSDLTKLNSKSLDQFKKKNAELKKECQGLKKS